MDTTTNRVALVTGGSGGIGRVVSERLARDGIAVAVHYAGNEAGANEVVGAITSSGGRAMIVGGDVADERAMAEVVYRRKGRSDSPTPRLSMRRTE